MLWTGAMLNVLSKKPCETSESKFSTTEALLLGEVTVNWKECTRVCANKLVSHNNSNNEGTIVVTCYNEQSFKATLKLILKCYCPSYAGRMQMNCARD